MAKKRLARRSRRAEAGLTRQPEETSPTADFERILQQTETTHTAPRRVWDKLPSGKKAVERALEGVQRQQLPEFREETTEELALPALPRDVLDIIHEKGREHLPHRDVGVLVVEGAGGGVDCVRLHSPGFEAEGIGVKYDAEGLCDALSGTEVKAVIALHKDLTSADWRHFLGLKRRVHERLGGDVRVLIATVHDHTPENFELTVCGVNPNRSEGDFTAALGGCETLESDFLDRWNRLTGELNNTQVVTPVTGETLNTLSIRR